MRRTEGDHLFVLVPGDREISWPKLRALLGVNRISMPAADAAREVTGYERGTISTHRSRTSPTPPETRDRCLNVGHAVVSTRGGPAR